MIYNYYPGLEWVIKQRIRDYEQDIQAVTINNLRYKHDADRIKQDKVIIQELNKILTGIGLERLSFVD